MSMELPLLLLRVYIDAYKFGEMSNYVTAGDEVLI